MRRSLYAFAIGLYAWAGFWAEAHAGVITTIALGTPTITAASAAFPVSILFPGMAGDTIEALQVSVLGSDPNLTGGGTDLSRFVFLPDTVTLPGWIELSPVNSSGVGLFVPPDTVGPFLLPSSVAQSIGTLKVDLSGIAGGTELLVTLAGGPVGENTDLGGTIAGKLIVSFAFDETDSVSLAFADPDGVNFSTPSSHVIPEPATYCSFAMLLLVVQMSCLAGRRQTNALPYLSPPATVGG